MAQGGYSSGAGTKAGSAPFVTRNFNGRRHTMKHALFLSAAAVAALSLAACNKPASTDTTSTTTATDTNQTAAGQAVDKAQDATGAAVGATSANTLGSHDTAAFVSNASQSDMYEIQAAQIAQQRSKNPAIKAFAKQMVTDHTAMMNEMKPLVAAAGQKPADSLDQRRQGFIDNLKSAKDADFDKTYADQQVAGHQEALDLMQGYAKDGSDAGLKAGAAKAVPKVQMHLDKIKGIQASLKK
jgi:putative membrane protein